MRVNCTLPNKDEIRADIANAILHMATRKTSSLLAAVLGIDPPKVAALRAGRLEIFSIERLFYLATRLAHDVEITIRPHPREGFRRARRGVVRVIDRSDPEEVP